MKNIKEVVFPLSVLVLCYAYFGLAVSVLEHKNVTLHPHVANDSFSVGYIQMKSAENCSYLVAISTSCSSPKINTDEISIVFGDAQGNQVYAPKLGDRISKTFEQCSSDTFQIDGPCTSQICFAYLRRSGSKTNGWEPETVKIFTYNTEPVTFTFDTPIPNDEWYGYNFCEVPPPPSPPQPHPPSPPTPSSSNPLYTFNSLIYAVLGVVLSYIWM
ncbi:hypothetical protein PIB30_007014 [Stylosanthes scabra]|uniref:Uncharacterized protein n=1 Tax=Stylosanthes scabra TaxID=79078 RepID=A0ABU6Z168_9FABA|nr:hypothetical protein [Stylosanthes scabra]